ncbi:hypothetical protein BLOT_012173 [Blomia tropicalis]|nr:hypothetical protein BLOT_012173 [Blomia tropicalis]
MNHNPNGQHLDRIAEPDEIEPKITNRRPKIIVLCCPINIKCILGIKLTNRCDDDANDEKANHCFNIFCIVSFVDFCNCTYNETAFG